MPEDVLEQEVQDEAVVEDVVDVVDDVSPEAPVEPAEASTPDEVRLLRDVGKDLGYDLSRFDDDHTALNHLIAQAKQADESRQQIAQYQQLLAAQQQQSQQQPPPPPAEEKPLWDPPSLNMMDVTQVTRDESGNYVPTNGGTPETVQKVLAYAQYRQDQQDKFWQNPYEYLRPFMEKVADERAGQGIRTDRNYSQAEQLVEQNADWLYTDASRNQYSEDGNIYSQAIQSFGTAHPGATAREQDTYGRALVEGERGKRAIAELDALKASQAASNGHDAKKRAAVSTPKPNSSGTLQQEIQNPELSLNEQLLAALRAAGVDDADLENDR